MIYVIIKALLIIIVPLIVTKIVTKEMRSILSRFHIVANIVTLINNAIWTIVILYIGVIIISMFGWTQAANLTAIFVLSLTLLIQGMFQSIIFGAFILIEKKFTIGDMVCVDGITGTVTDIGIRLTTLVDKDGNSIYIPNSSIYSSTISIIKSEQENINASKN